MRTWDCLHSANVRTAATEPEVHGPPLGRGLVPGLAREPLGGLHRGQPAGGTRELDRHHQTAADRHADRGGPHARSASPSTSIVAMMPMLYAT